MNRREALSKVAFILGSTVIGGEAFAAGIRLNPGTYANQLFTPEDEKVLHEIGGLILPAINDKPGAKEAKIGAFIVMIVSDCYPEDQQKIFTTGLQKIKKEFKSIYGKTFLEADASVQLEFLNKLDEEQRVASAGIKYNIREIPTQEAPPVHYFLMMRQLTILGFCTSEVGATKALRYVEAPGHYNGNVTYKKGEGAWAI